MTLFADVRTPRALDLFCGAGGAARGLMEAGFHVFIQANAFEFFATANPSLYAFIWASPHCQRHSMMKHARNAKGDAHPDQIGPTRELLQRIGLPWCIENVVGSPLINPIRLCGSMFGLKTPAGAELRRHRLFETSFPLLAPCCQHGRGGVIGVYGGHSRNRSRASKINHRPGSNRPRQHAFIAMGIDWPMTTAEISQAVPPAYAKFIVEQWLRQAKPNLKGEHP